MYSLLLVGGLVVDDTVDASLRSMIGLRLQLVRVASIIRGHSSWTTLPLMSFISLPFIFIGLLY
jgi:hypothetical protein